MGPDSRTQIVECMDVMETGMIRLEKGDLSLRELSRLLWWFCKAIIFFLKGLLKTRIECSIV